MFVGRYDDEDGDDSYVVYDSEKLIKFLQRASQVRMTLEGELMTLCYVEKFELIPTNNFQVMSILKTSQFLQKSKGYSPWFYSKISSEITPNFYYIF